MSNVAAATFCSVRTSSQNKSTEIPLCLRKFGNVLAALEEPFSTTANSPACFALEGSHCCGVYKKTKPALSPNPNPSLNLSRRWKLFQKRMLLLGSRFRSLPTLARGVTPMRRPSSHKIGSHLGSLRQRHRSFKTVSGAGLFSSSCALTFCRPAVSASICFCKRAMVAPCSCTVLCSLRNSLSSIAFTIW